MRASRLFVVTSLLVVTTLVGCASAPTTAPASSSTTDGAQANSDSTNAPSLASSTTERQRTDAAPKADVVCTKKGDERTLTIQEIGSGCWMMYVNKGIKKRSAWSKKGNSHCEKVRDQIRGTLVKSGYTCR